MKRKLFVAVSSTLAASGTLYFAPSYAAEPAGATGLEEVVVMARRREENLQEVPIAITAMSGADLEDRSITNIQNMNTLLPNVSIAGNGPSGSSGGIFVMRGIPGVSRYVDGIVQQTHHGSLTNVVELERVEVLRGPQGTLFGKNAIGGAIQYITKKPAEEFGARVSATVGNFDRRDVIANVDVPLSDTFFTKVTAASLNRDGYVSSDFVDIKYGNQNNDILRGQLAWRPSEAFEATFTIDRSQIEENQSPAVLYDVIDTQANVRQYNAASLIFNDEIHAYGGREQYRNRSTYTGVGNEWASTSYALDVSWNINDTLTFRSLTGGRGYDYGNYQDLDASEYAFFEQWWWIEGEEMSQEFQLLGSSDRFSWTTGLYYAREKSDQLWLRWQYEEVAARPRSDVTETETADYAVFAEMTYRATDSLSITAGLRYTEEEFENAVFNSTEPRPQWQRISKNIAHGTPLGPRNEAKFDALTPRVSVQYNWTDTIMTYLTYSEGFNGGGVNGGAPINGEFLPYDGETLRQYELGFRSDLFGNSLRLNANAFKGYWDDIQIGEVLVPGQQTTRNGGAAEVQGVELDLLWRATDSLTINMAGGWLDTKYTKLGNTTTIRLNSEFAYAPETSFSAGASYQWDLTGGSNLRLRADYGWIGDHFTTDDIRLQTKQDAYGLLSGRVTFTPASGNWDIALVGTNLTDQWYQAGGFSATLGGVDNGVVARPREIAVAVSARF
jgi:iron complex outermembrane receptor protein